MMFFRNLSKYNQNMKLLFDKAYVNGSLVESCTGKTFKVNNPANGAVITTVPDMNVEDATNAVQIASEAFKCWQSTTPKERGQLLRQWYNIIESHREDLAVLMTAESGKALIESRGEVTYGNSFIDWFSEEARRIKGEYIDSSVKTKRLIVRRQPIGVAALITPWNFPLAMITRKAGAALASGCTCVIKPAEDTPLTALALAKLAEEAGFPKGVINVITCNRDNAPSIGQYLCETSLVAGVSFTGSIGVGKILYKQCASTIKRLSLELGGNGPFIVFNSANIAKAVEGAIVAKFRNCGQTCVAANRFLLQEEIFDEFIGCYVERIKSLKLGNGTDKGVDLGPLINKPHLQKVSALVNDAVDKGAKVLLGGKPAPHLGELFYEPTVLVDVDETMKLYTEEVFGPVASVIRFKNEKEAIEIANCTKTGLAGYFYSEDISQIFRVSEALEVGMVGINEGLISTAEAPFGGIKESGIGREGSHHGIEEYSYYKYMCIGI